MKIQKIEKRKYLDFCFDYVLSDIMLKAFSRSSHCAHSFLVVLSILHTKKMQDQANTNTLVCERLGSRHSPRLAASFCDVRYSHISLNLLFTRLWDAYVNLPKNLFVRLAEQYTM